MINNLKTAVWGKEFFEKQNVTLAFRLKFNAKDNEKAAFTLSAKQLYKVIFNGKFIHYGPERTAHGYSKADRLELHCASGENVLVVEVYQSGVINYYLPFERACFSANLKVDGKEYSTEDFTCYYVNDRKENVQRYCGQRTFIEDYIASACRSEFYSGSDLFNKTEVTAVDLDNLIEKDCEYPMLESYRQVRMIESGRFIERKKRKNYSLPYLTRARKNGEKIDYEILTDRLNDFTYYRGDKANKGGEYYLYEFDREISGFINLDLTVLEDAEVLITFDEVLLPQKNKNGALRLHFARMSCANVVRWKLKKGRYKLSTFEAYSFKFIKLHVCSGKIDDVNVYATRYENGANEIFDCEIEDKELENIVVAAYNTFRQNSVDMLFDCPSRERAGWINDAWFSRECSYLFGGDEKAFKSLLRAYALAPDLGLPTGMIPMCYPSDFKTGLFMVACALWYVCCLNEYEKTHTCDEIVELGKKKIVGLLEYLKGFENELGLLEDIKGKVFVEWSKANTKPYVKGVNFPSNMLYAKALVAASELFDDESLLEKAKRVKEKIIELSFNGEFFEDNAVRKHGKLTLLGHVTEVCQYYAFECGVADKKSFPQLYKVLLENFVPRVPAPEKYSFVTRSNIIIGLLIREKLAVKNGEFDRAKEELKSIYSLMANKTGTLWEHEREKASCNHGIAAFAGVCVIKAITGYDGVLDGVLIFNRIEYKTNCDITFPCGKEKVRVTVKDGKMSVQTNLQYKIV